MPRISFAIIWKIENFSFLPKSSEHDEVTSSVFVADNMEKTSWNLLLRTPTYSQIGYSNDDEFRFYLSKSSRTEPNVFSVDYELSVLSKRGLKDKSISVNKFRFHMGNSLGTPLCIPRDEIFGKREILPGDTLTVQCKMWYNQNQYNLDPGFSLARTRIDAERKFFTWNIDKFSTLCAGDQRTVSVLLFSSQHICVTITLSLTNSWGSLSGDDNINITLKGKSKEKSFYLMLGISVQDKNDEPAHHFQDELKLKKESEKFYLSFTLKRKQLLEAKDSLLPGDVLSLKCEMAAYDVVFNRTELSVFGRNAESELRAALNNTNTPFHLGKRKRHSSSNSLTYDLRYLFEEKQHADISLRVQTETFPVHRAILAARSLVFKTMFDTDMKEKFTNTIEVSDIEPDTMRRLLLYIYSETWDSSIQWEHVSNLYLAAEKYSVLGLKEKCSSYLRANISIVNVGEIFVLADMLDDSDLKDFVLNFIQDKCEQVMNSSEWKHFTQEHPQLTIDILTRLYKNVKQF